MAGQPVVVTVVTGLFTKLISDPVRHHARVPNEPAFNDVCAIQFVPHENLSNESSDDDRRIASTASVVACPNYSDIVRTRRRN
jgi:hypothetical protein